MADADEVTLFVRVEGAELLRRISEHGLKPDTYTRCARLGCRSTHTSHPPARMVDAG